MPTYLSHFPPKCSAADQLLCVLPVALCSPSLRVREFRHILFNVHTSKDISVSNISVPPSPLRHCCRRGYSTSRGSCIPLRNPGSRLGGASSPRGPRTQSYRSMATAAILLSSKAMRPGFKPIIEKETLSKRCNIVFDPEKHLAFTPPSKSYTMKDLNLDDIGVSPIAVSEPFQLFSPEAIEQMRAEVLSDPVWENCQYSSNLAQCQLRGFAPELVFPAFA